MLPDLRMAEDLRTQAGTGCEGPSHARPGPPACHVSVPLRSSNGPHQQPQPGGSRQSLPGQPPTHRGFCELQKKVPSPLPKLTKIEVSFVDTRHFTDIYQKAVTVQLECQYVHRAVALTVAQCAVCTAVRVRWPCTIQVGCVGPSLQSSGMCLATGGPCTHRATWYWVGD